MKWFANKKISSFPDERVNQFVDYLTFPGERPERESTITALYDTIRNYPDEIESHTYSKVLRMDNMQINYWISMFGSAEAINSVIKYTGTTQEMLNNVLNNKNLSQEHLADIEPLLDNSPKGDINKFLLQKRWMK